MKESYIKLPNITVSKLQDVVDYLDENNIEYIEDYKEEAELNKYKEVLDKIKEYIKVNMEEYGGDIYLTCKEINDLLEEIDE